MTKYSKKIEIIEIVCEKWVKTDLVGWRIKTRFGISAAPLN